MMTKSHNCEFSLKELLGVFLPPLAPVAWFALTMHAGAWMHFLPDPRPALDIDRTILLHQVDLSHQPSACDTLFVGDSSCLMNVSIPQFNAAQTHASSALNLGTLSYLDLTAFAKLLQNYTAQNSGRLKKVVLLMNPEALRRPKPYEYDLEVLENYQAKTDFCGPDISTLVCYAGSEIFRGRILSRVLPQPLPGAFGRYYGFNQNLWQFLSQNNGSGIEPDRFDASKWRGNPEYRLASTLEEKSKAFRRALPEGADLFFGITPIPESIAESGYLSQRHELFHQWNQGLAPAVPLEELPATLPDDLFGTFTHLNAAGARIYTQELIRTLARIP